MEECTDVVAAGAEPEIIAKGEIRVGWSEYLCVCVSLLLVWYHTIYTL
jgi:hypothetical protein